MERMSLNVSRDGLRPPWTQKTWSSTTQLNVITSKTWARQVRERWHSSRGALGPESAGRGGRSVGERELAYLRAALPHLRRAEVTQALVVEAVHLRDLATLVIASDHVDAVRVPDLQCDQQQEGL